MAKIRLDLHDIFNKGQAIDAELCRVMNEAVSKRIPLVEIITGKGSGELKKRVLRFLDQPAIKQLYHRVEKDDKNFGRVFVHFKPMSDRKKIGLYGYSSENKRSF
ncbi:DNA mismatch repair protein MutS [Candidatus Velamenicoccus archaeovorus]|uniref:DNA mismatch repair protein MutS n=1 Tax=Velamenicoccus archaeovorus TaxID=1930593 RepID=A0A410P376_VELA1|nr:Smr/MutS family protein [Candidatus Velamenicoccus archaeovorus]QAT16551.1 DNA mismatch repair protein MutS [Candidatus Velamenicoccus archaeovorus]